MEYWEILLQKQRERGKDGLTIPFLIGAQKYLPAKFIEDDIEALILGMVRSGSFETCIRHCISTQTFVCEIRKLQNKAFYPSYEGEPQQGLSVSFFSKDDLGDTIEALIENLKDLFQDNIDHGNFSAESNVDDRSPHWLPFSEKEDLPFIKKCFALLS